MKIPKQIPTYGKKIKGCKVPESAHMKTFFNTLRREYPEYAKACWHTRNEGKRTKDPNLRVLGLTSSPYKLGHGYIYGMDINGKPIPEDKAKKPFFAKQIVHISGRELLDQGQEVWVF